MNVTLFKMAYASIKSFLKSNSGIQSMSHIVNNKVRKKQKLPIQFNSNIQDCLRVESSVTTPNLRVFIKISILYIIKISINLVNPILVVKML
jgi:hypothetical protein